MGFLPGAVSGKDAPGSPLTQTNPGPVVKSGSIHHDQLSGPVVISVYDAGGVATVDNFDCAEAETFLSALARRRAFFF